MKTVNFVGKPKTKPIVGKHARHEAREGVNGEYEEDVREYAKKHPASAKVKNVSLWTIHGKGK